MCLNFQRRRVGINLVSRYSWLTLVETILLAFQAFAAGEGSEASPRTTLTVAAAADLKFALGNLVAEFEAKNPAIKVNVTYGSSGNFFAQLQNGAPFDLFFSADVRCPQKLAVAGLSADEIFVYATGRIVVWVPKDSPLDVDKLGIKALLDPSIRRIAVANPNQAPYGRAAVAAMKTFAVYDQVAGRLVYGEDIAQTAQLVQSGAADIGILSLSLALAPEMYFAGRFWEIPLDAYPLMEQGGLILKSTKNLQTSRLFRDFVLGHNGGEVLKCYGYF